MLFYSMNGHCRLHSSALHTYICHLKIRASSLQFWASKINMALVRMDKLVKKLMSNPADLYNLECTTGLLMGDCWWGTDLCNLECTTGLLMGDCWWGTDQGSTLTVVRLPGANEMRLRASENYSVIWSIPEEQND